MSPITSPSPADGGLADTPERTPDEAFIVRLGALHHSRDRALSALLRWTPDNQDPQQLVDVARATEGADLTDYDLRATVGRGFATYHSGKSRIDYGYPGTNLGTALRRIGSSSQGYGPRNPATARLLQQIVTAETLTDLTTLINTACKQLKSDAPAPHWLTLLTDLRDWQDPARRHAIRLRWAQAFYTNPPKKTSTKKKAH
ncbi:type I-E CRISPR-associated protein Cse2/CasB [Gordonia sihwensis]|uniref:type I-E CRISPR-associated protein Cse2/CasB n=1 Tax=Gordonia sihwensis TaxID=173559 RepID=UPI0005EEDE4F|nr:type I-E CRISPR-associated protein Cse2/CasB [Gordonia sihwensis]KJR10510.1 hypothetical protein UG54_00495 [Gordonia sihwensis]